jgi:hypothetical protein
LYLVPCLTTLDDMPTYHLACPYCGEDDLSPFPDPLSAWSCLGCLRVLRVEMAQPASVSGWGMLRVVQPAPAA